MKLNTKYFLKVLIYNHINTSLLLDCMQEWIRWNFKIPKKFIENNFKIWAQLIRNCSFVSFYYLEKSFLNKIYYQFTMIKNKNTHDLISKNIYVEKFIQALDSRKSFIKVLLVRFYQKWSLKGNIISKEKQNQKYKVKIRSVIQKLEKNLEEVCCSQTSKIINSFYEINKKKSQLLSLKNKVNYGKKDSRIQLFQSDSILIDYVLMNLFSQNGHLIKFQNKILNQNLISSVKEFKEVAKILTAVITTTLKKLMQNDKFFNQKQQFVQMGLLSISNLPSALNQLEYLDIDQPISCKCLGCIQYFYQYQPFQIKYSTLNNYHIIQSIKYIKQFPQKVIEAVGSLLNSIKPNGIILFNCQKILQGFIPEGTQLKLNEQENFKNSFISLINNYIQTENYNKSFDILIDFIPVKEDPKFNQGKVMNDILNRVYKGAYIKNCSVMRVKITSKYPELVFNCRIDKQIYTFKHQNCKPYQLIGTQVYEQMRQKVFYLKNVSKQKLFKNYLNLYEFEIAMKYIKGKKQHKGGLHEGQCLDVVRISGNKYSQQ